MEKSERFDSRYMPVTESGCWLWTGIVDVNGYGRLYLDAKNKSAYAHRISFERFVGPIPKGQSVCHTCDIPACVNPRHMFLGDQRQNMHDMVRKGRNAKGETNGVSKLTESDVLAIRATPKKLGYRPALAKRFGVSKGTISFIRNGGGWEHLKHGQG